MERKELVQTLTLWFAVMIFLQTAAGNADSQVLDAIGIVAIVLMYLLPLWIVGALVSDILGDQ